MGDFICRNTMMRCNTPGMCVPHGGCKPQDVQKARIAELERKLEQAEQIINRECQAAAAYRMQALELERELEACRKDAERLRTLLVEASETIEEWGAYADDYFKEKHGLARDVAHYRDAAMQEGGV